MAEREDLKERVEALENRATTMETMATSLAQRVKMLEDLPANVQEPIKKIKVAVNRLVRSMKRAKLISPK